MDVAVSDRGSSSRHKVERIHVDHALIVFLVSEEGVSPASLLRASDIDPDAGKSVKEDQHDKTRLEYHLNIFDQDCSVEVA